jgi:aspartate racemase
MRQGEAHWSVPIGWPIANTQVYVLDPHLHLMPIGVPGELYIGGLGLARGYLNRPELTTERFICHPFSGEPGEQLYKTGDVARYRTDGMLEFLGRMDHQVKVRGFRIELGEIEAVLRQHPALRETVVLAREDSPGEKRLVAYVVPVPAQAPTTTELRSFLKAKLPDYMVPAVFVWLDSLPLTPSGKVDRRALPIPDQAQPELPGTSIVPRDVLEFQLTTIWEEALGIQSISVTDNFFDLGGHSLLAVRLFAQIEKTFGQKLPLATLFQAPTVEQLANVLRQEGWSPPWSSLVAIQPGGSKPPFFCVHAHGGHVFVFKDLAKHLGPDQPFYGLQALGLNDDQARPRGSRDMMAHHRIEEMAVHYLKEIQTLQPEGPYFLGGYCFGGKVAFEMAQKLYAQGQKVGLLVLLDAYAPGYPKKLPWVRRAVIQRINFHVGNLRRLGPQERLNYILEKGGIVRTKVETKLKKIACKVYLGFGRSLTRAPREVQEASPRAFSRYAPSVYPGRITLFRPSQQPKSCYPDPHMGWSGLAAGGLEIYEVPGPFAGIIIEPNVRVMAERLRVCLEEALTTPSSQVQQ